MSQVRFYAIWAVRSLPCSASKRPSTDAGRSAANDRTGPAMPRWRPWLSCMRLWYAQRLFGHLTKCLRHFRVSQVEFRHLEFRDAVVQQGKRGGAVVPACFVVLALVGDTYSRGRFWVELLTPPATRVVIETVSTKAVEITDDRALGALPPERRKRKRPDNRGAPNCIQSDL